MVGFFETSCCICIILVTTASIYVAVIYHVLYGIALWVGSVIVLFILFVIISSCYYAFIRQNDAVHPECTPHIIKEPPLDTIVIQHPDDSLSLSAIPKLLKD